MANTGSITPKSGRDFLLKVSDGTSPTSYVTVAGLTNTSITLNGNPVDVTNKSSAGWSEMFAAGGVRSMQVSASGLLDSSSTQLEALQTAILNQTNIEAELVSGKGDRYLGTFVVTNFERGGDHTNAETFSVTLSSHGPVTYSAS